MKNRRVLLNVLKVFCLLSCFLLLCPFFQLTNGFLGPQPAAVLWFQLGTVCLSGFCGVGAGMLFHRTAGKYPVLSRLAEILCCLLAAWAVFGIQSLRLPLLESVLGGVLGGASCVMGVVFSLRPYDRILSQPILLKLAGIQIGVIALLAWQEKPMEISVSVFITLFVLLNFFVMSNQSNLEALMERGSHGLEYLPKRIRSFNLGLVLALYAFLAVCYLFRDAITAAAAWMGNLLWILVRSVILFLYHLFAGGEEETPLQDPASSGGGQAPILPRNEGSDLVNTILWILFLALIAGLLWYYRRQILSGIRQLWESLADRVYRLFHPEGGQKRRAEPESHEYIDEITELSRTKESGVVKEGKSLRKWKQAYRRYKKMPDGEKKYREGYRLILLWLSLQKKPQAASRTPREIFEDTREQVNSPFYGQATAGYEEIRYGEIPASEEERKAVSETIRKMAE